MTRTAVILASLWDIESLADRPTSNEAQQYMEDCLLYKDLLDNREEKEEEW